MVIVIPIVGLRHIGHIINEQYVLYVKLHVVEIKLHVCCFLELHVNVKVYVHGFELSTKIKKAKIKRPKMVHDSPPSQDASTHQS